MFNSPFYRAGDDLVSLDGIVIAGQMGMGDFSCFRIRVPGNGIVTVTKQDHPEEYKRYLALYSSAPLLIARLAALQTDLKNEVTRP